MITNNEFIPVRGDYSKAQVQRMRAKYESRIAELKSKLRQANNKVTAWQNTGREIVDTYSVPKDEINSIYRNEKNKLDQTS